MSENIVKVDSLVKRYGENIAVDHFSLEVKKGEILGLLGPNGSGKTTTINCILSLLNYDKGSIEVFGQKMSPERFDLKRRIGVVPQNVAVLNALTVEENIDFFCGLYLFIIRLSCFIYIKDKAERKACIEEALEFTGLTEFRKQKPKKLSGGLLRRLNIACGIAHKPELIFFDEPTVAVDPQSRNAILEGIRKMNEQGSTVIYTSHYMEEVEELCSRIVIMDHGKNEAEGTSQSLKSSLRNRETIRINMPVHEKELLDQIRNINHVYDVRIDEEDVIIKCDGGEHNLVHILNFLSEKQLPFGRVTTELPTLNDVFLEITGKELRD